MRTQLEAFAIMCYVNLWSTSDSDNNILEALGQCIPPPRHILSVWQYGSVSGSRFKSVTWITTKI